MQGYKGFNEQLQCTPEGNVFQYAVGETYRHPGMIDLCESGFHFVENPLEVLNYYPPTGRFAEVEAEDVHDATENGSTKRVARSLHIKAELSLSALLHLAVKYILDQVEWKNAPATNTGDRSAATNTGHSSAATNTGHRSAATNTGDSSAATNTGDSSAATNTGDSSAATNTGHEGCAVSLGIKAVARGALGCWLTLAEWEQDTNGLWHRVNVKTVRVDGKKILPNVFYRLQKGKFLATEWSQE